jgi:dipeptidyl aminopeptidase/acylaminoacyl peptidase
MITESNMFAAACAGAPVSNMFSAYGGIRWGSGLVRQMQYEHGQSRIDGTPWNSFQRYMENSPIFYADKVQTPLLIMHNDKDGAVPWWQSIEYFTALRRLDKPVWMAVYNNEDHNLVQRKNRKDWSIRMQQFFDHYLKGAPQPVWMKDGVPAAKKGKTYGFEVPEERKAASGSGGN